MDTNIGTYQPSSSLWKVGHLRLNKVSDLKLSEKICVQEIEFFREFHERYKAPTAPILKHRIA